MKDQDVKNRFVELRATGLSFDRIARELNVSKKTLITWSKELSTEISNLKAIELEALQEKYFMTKEMRIECFGEMLKDVKTELSKRDLNDLSTDKLHDLLIKYSNLLKQEGANIVFKEESYIPDFSDLSKTQIWEA